MHDKLIKAGKFCDVKDAEHGFIGWTSFMVVARTSATFYRRVQDLFGEGRCIAVSFAHSHAGRMHFRHSACLLTTFDHSSRQTASPRSTPCTMRSDALVLFPPTGKKGGRACAPLYIRSLPDCELCRAKDRSCACCCNEAASTRLLLCANGSPRIDEKGLLPFVYTIVNTYVASFPATPGYLGHS